MNSVCFDFCTNFFHLFRIWYFSIRIFFVFFVFIIFLSNFFFKISCKYFFIGVPTCFMDTFFVCDFIPFNIWYAPKNFCLFSSDFFALPIYFAKFAFKFHLSKYFFKIILFCSSLVFLMTKVLLFKILFLKKFEIICHLWK